MYADFYGLKEKPFNLTPSPRFLYLGETHKEALALLTYGVAERKGFILLTGEVGTGKTTIIQALLAGLDQNIQYVYLSNPLFSPEEFMDYLASSAFKRKVHLRNKAEFLVEFEGFLKECLQHQRIFILILDEAQKLSYELLEEIRLLSNMETADEKLINIFLVGQPELNDRLSEPRCRPLLQRISVRHHIKPLDFDAVREYVLTRMRIAGCKDASKIFPKETIRALHRLSGGYPRLINVLADNALLVGYTRETRKIPPSIIEECSRDMRLDRSLPERPREVPEASSEVPAEKGLGKWRVAIAAAAVAILFVLLGLTVGSQDFAERLRHFWGTPDKPLVEEKKPILPAATPREEAKAPAQENPISADAKHGQGTDAKGNMKPPLETASGPRAAPADLLAESVASKEGSSWRTMVVKPGDTLTELAITVYGRVDQAILDAVKRSNPQMLDVNRIEVGQKFRFPPLTGPGSHLTYTVHVASFKPFGSARELFDRLIAEGYEAYIVPVNDPQKGKIFRVTVGSFEDPQQAQDQSQQLVSKGVSDYAKVIQVEMR
jgi:general secretion pathway protein A